MNYGSAATDLFYQELFKENPLLKHTLFKNVDDAQQGERLFAMLDTAVKWLTKLDDLVPVLRACGARHVHYHVTPDMYPAVGAALLRTLELGLGNQFTPEVKQAWLAVYGVIVY